jgi:hypothetical protein
VIVTVLVGGFVLAYLIHNKMLVGYFTGRPRIPAPETNIELSKQLVQAITKSLVFPFSEWNPRRPMESFIVAVQAAGMLYVFTVLRRSRGSRSFQSAVRDNVAFSFLLIGALYLVSIVSLRWRTQFDEFGRYRLLAPGMLMLLFGILRTIEVRFSCIPVVVSRFLLTLAGLSLLATAYPLHSPNHQTYSETVHAIEIRYSAVESGAIVAFGNMHLRYLRPDLHIALPMFRPYAEVDEQIDQFLKALDQNRPQYVDASQPPAEVNRYAQSVRMFLKGFKPRQLVRIHPGPKVPEVRLYPDQVPATPNLAF